jgi:hypothetical protein
MPLPSETFPYKPLSAEQTQVIVASCGGAPVDDPTLLRNFLQFSGLPLIGGFRWESYFNAMARQTAFAFGYEDRSSYRSVNRGILFYAGVTAEASGLNEVAYHPMVIQEIGDADCRNRGIEALQVIAEETQGFCELMADVRSGMETQLDSQQYTFALMGAGLAHMVNTRSTERHLIDAEAALLTDYEIET